MVTNAQRIQIKPVVEQIQFVQFQLLTDIFHAGLKSLLIFHPHIYIVI